ncbi:hypothetical protein [Ponticoccus litoralis]|uniref:Uncharacterized protein n=1 Tax=Ponticoccus litoralis TaxID=422297 RepID=A0AAW9SAN6_9RHOB
MWPTVMSVPFTVATTLSTASSSSGLRGQRGGERRGGGCEDLACF